MADQVDHQPEVATLKRSGVVRGLIQRTFAVTFFHFSQLKGRTIEQFCWEKKTSHIKRFFTDEEKTIIRTGNPPEHQYCVHLQHKLLKHCCGLSQYSDPVWSSEDKSDTLEFHITNCYTEYKNLKQAGEMTDCDLNHRMDKVLEALVWIVEKVEDCKEVDESDLKSELTMHIGKKLDLNIDVPVSHRVYPMFSQHSVHTMLIIVYQELNKLNGEKLSTFLNNRKININPTTVYSNERRFIEQNPLPQNMSISILHKVVRRVCFDFNPRQRNRQPSDLESTLRELQQEYNTLPASEEEHMEKSEKIYKLLETSLMEVIRQIRGKKTLKEIIQSLPKGPYVVKSFPEPFEHSVGLVQSGPKKMKPAAPVPDPQSPNKGSVSSMTSPSLGIALESTKASDHCNLTIEQCNVAIVFSLVCPGGLVVQTLDLIFRALKGSVKKVAKKHFTNDEKKKIEKYQNSTNQVSLANEDVTFVCKLLRYGCPCLSQNDDDWTKSEFTLEYCITLVRKERNKLFHDVSTISSDELSKTLNIIETNLTTLLDMSQQKLGSEKNNMKKNLETQKEKVTLEIERAAKSRPPWSEECMKESTIGKIIRGGRMELKEMNLYRENLLNMSPLGGNDGKQQSLTTSAVYVDRNLEDMNGIKGEGTCQIKDILFSKDGDCASSRVTVIYGGHGEGKTSLCKHAYHLWSENLEESSKKGVELLIYIPCRFVTTKSISAYLKERLPATFKDIVKDDIIPLMQEPRVVFVIDGYDEAGREAKNLIDDILNSLPDSRVIITTKTQWLPKLIQKVKSITLSYKVFSMVEVTDDMRQQFIRKIFKAVGTPKKKCDKFLEYLSEVQKGNTALICSPLTFCLLSLLWIKDDKKAKEIKTLAQLYYNLYDLILERVSEKISKDKFYCQEWMITLGEIAWNNLKNNQHHLSDHDLKTLQRKTVYDLRLEAKLNDCILLNFLQCEEVHDSLSDDAKQWNFTITSQQEYFAADYIVDCLLKEKNSCLSKFLELDTEENDKYKKKLQRLVPVVKFVCELLVIHNSLNENRLEEITKLLSIKEPWAFKEVKDMFQSILGKPNVKRAIKSLFMNQEMNKFENYDPQSVLWMLEHTSLTVPRQVTFQNTVKELPNLKHLLEYLLNARSKSYSIKVIVDVDKVCNIPNLAEFAANMREGITFTYVPWKPVCIHRLVQSWAWSSRPLRLFLYPEVLPLVWWELLISLLSCPRVTRRIDYNTLNEKFRKMMVEGAKWLNAQAGTDSSLAPAEVLVYFSSHL